MAIAGLGLLLMALQRDRESRGVREGGMKGVASIAGYDEIFMEKKERLLDGVVKKTVHKRNRRTKVWEPALHARARQVVHRGELGG